MSVAEMKSEVVIDRQTAALGACIYGYSLAEAIAANDKSFVQKMILDHHAVCFRDQDLSPAQHVDFSKMLGEFYIQPVVHGLPDHPEIIEVNGTRPFTESWHQDSTHSEFPPRFTILIARTVPACGNDTMFANQHLAYEKLSPRFKELLSTLSGVHYTLSPAQNPKDDDGPYRYTEFTSETATHPAVRTHPDTGRKALYINDQYTRHFEGMLEDESRPLISYLARHCSQPAFAYRHRWRSGDVLIWDNASVQHAVVGDSPPGTVRTDASDYDKGCSASLIFFQPDRLSSSCRDLRKSASSTA